jgi:hypothetical protein
MIQVVVRISRTCAYVKAQQTRDWNLAKQPINRSKIKWALSTLKPFKSVGTDGIVRALLEQGAEYLVPHLCHIFRTYMAYGFIPMAPGGK